MPRLLVLIVVALLLAAFCSVVDAASVAERIVVIKADGLPFEIVDRLVRERDPYTGKSLLPWIEHVFYQNGTRLSNFYSRGLSLSAPSWAIVDTGQHSLIKGNLEFDRLTLESFDYLNIFSFVLKNSTGRATETPAAKLLSEYGVPVLSDAYLPSERHLGMQVVGRGLKSVSLPGGLKRLLTLQSPKEWLDEWTIGLEGEDLLFEVLERELISKLKNPRIRYLDFLVPFFDHTAHSSREPEAQLRAVQKIDGVVKRIWTAIQQTPLASKTIVILVSDHGMNTDPDVYSQGFNLIDFFGSAEGGGHHILTNRPPQSAYSLKALSPTVPLVITPSSESAYLKGMSSDYPTLALDADGNERASVYLRHSDLNVLHLLWQQLSRSDLKPEFRSAVARAFVATIDRNRSRWNLDAAELQQMRGYETYLRAIQTLLALQPNNLDTSRGRLVDLVAKKTFGQSNSIYDLQNYVVGVGADGLVLDEDGSLDLERSFRRLNYFSVLQNIQSRNNLQVSVSSRPVDFIAARVPAEALVRALPLDLLPINGAVWLYKNDEVQALIVWRQKPNAPRELRYVPVHHLTQDNDGDLRFEMAEWSNDLPLQLQSDSEWLENWHTEKEWLDSFHASEYSNAVISLYEQFADTALNFIAPPQKRKRLNAHPDFVMFANNHWNFNFRGFNPGGNHGAFFRASTRATLMMTGGTETRIPRGLLIDSAYDALSFAPTVLLLTGRKMSAVPLPGPVIDEIFRESIAP